jgi:hypothetical protein
MKNILKPASIADIKDCNDKNKIKSFVGHINIKYKNEEFPKLNGLRMFPFCQIIIEDLPFIPEKLKEYKAITVFFPSFLVDGELHCSMPKYCYEEEKDYIIRGYKSLENIEMIEYDLWKFESDVKELNFKKIEDDIPSIDELEMILEDKSNLQETYKNLRKEHKNNSGFKVGGYANILQNPLEDIDDFVIQLTGVEDICYFGDDGNAYITLDEDGEFYLEWQSL